MQGNDTMTSARDAAGDLVAALSALRAQAGAPSMRKISSMIADQAGERISHTTIAEALNGRRVPSWPAVAAIVRVLGGDEQAFQRAWVAATHRPATPTASERADVLFIADYRRLVASYYNSTTPGVGAARSKFSDVYEPAQVVRFFPGAKHFEELEATAFADDIRHALLLGDIATGKTTLCQALMLRHALEEDRPVAFLVPLRRFAAQSTPDKSVVGFIEQSLESVFQLRPPIDLIERHLQREPTLVIFDGLDELLDRDRVVHVASIIQLFSSRYPLARILVTSADRSHSQGLFDPTVFSTYVFGSDVGLLSLDGGKERDSSPNPEEAAPPEALSDLKAISELLNRSSAEQSFGRAALALSWATLERCLKQRLIGTIREQGPTWNGEALLKLYGDELLATAEARELITSEDVPQLRSSWDLRNQVVHGMESPAATSSQLVKDAVAVVIRAIYHLNKDAAARSQ